MNIMCKWKVSFPINGLRDVINQMDSAINIDGVIFHFRGNERIGTVVIEKNVTIEDAKEESKYLIDRSLAKICFAFNTEASISPGG